ncbi:MAG: DUF4340 domain-containing protein [Bacteroidia bacterium]|nr:DUF4340 domain-containing protein [Bacteroidia bacterium]
MKNKLVLIIFLIFLIIAAVVYFTQQKGTTKKELTDFAVKDTALVTKIFMVDKKNNQVILTRENSYWKVNNKYIARQDAIGILLETIASVKMKSPVPKPSIDNIIKRLATKSVKVEIYQGENLVKTYYVGEPTADQGGTYMILDNSSVPFITHKPGFIGYLSTRYFVDEKLWRDNSVFMYSYSDIVSVSVSIQNAPDKAFTVFNDGNNIFRLQDFNKKEVTGFNSLIVKEFIAGYKKVKCESYVNEFFSDSRLDSLLQVKPLAILSVTDKKGEVNTLKLYLRPNFSGALDDNGKPITSDPDAMYGILNNERQVLVCQYYVFDPLMKNIEYFFQKTPS